MGNHVAAIENLIEHGSAVEAAEYAGRVRQEFDGIRQEINTGNPVSDIILYEYLKKCSAKDVGFEADFSYPESGRMDSFDMSVVLFNALANAYEASAGISEPMINIKSSRRSGIYMIEVRNRMQDSVDMDPDTGLPLSSKSGEGHGYGLKNIRKVALKYGGDIDIRQETDGEGFPVFILDIMMLLKE